MFEEIKKKYPKAWEKWQNYTKDHCLAVRIDYTEFYVSGEDFLDIIGWLFKFFDEQGIHIAIDWNNFKYSYTLYVPHHDIVSDDSSWYESRIEAWEAAFTKAFGILEEQ